MLILILVGGFVAAAISGAAGFGGALLLLPLLTHTVGAREAVPLLTVGSLVGNLARVALGFTEIRWQSVGLFLLAAVPAATLGALSFVSLPKSLVVRLIGAALLAFVVLRMSGRMRFSGSRRLLLVGGGVVGLLSGLVGSAGPLGAAVFLSLNLPPVAYVASEASTAVVMHAVKAVIYQRALHMDRDFWLLAGFLSLSMVAGTWVGKRIIEAIPVDRFQQLVVVLLIAVALQMLILG